MSLTPQPIGQNHLHLHMRMRMHMRLHSTLWLRHPLTSDLCMRLRVSVIKCPLRTHPTRRYLWAPSVHNLLTMLLLGHPAAHPRHHRCNPRWMKR